MEANTRGEDSEDDELKILEHRLVSVMEELQCEDVHSQGKTDRIHSRICYASQGRCKDGYCLTAGSGSAYERKAQETKFKPKQRNKKTR
ncbi:hypothetical protein CY34DRAFT_814284 [Suillus luteus UH-Slu-Lm8-n1]|uniref:Uncharacterized protein n=1 Tax=Suillus luteus UH-Slu-Lm8-n1 TaxID=930992 RepID=A0A0C9ZT23_9AGAM|nr:hypothetical protein CY34DRAFT_814284 [Suillus luteus UH-Slu-Lm8-n1]